MDYGDPLRRKLKPRRIQRKVVAELRRATAPIAARRSPLRNQSFAVGASSFTYFVHPHNTTWRNERAVEIPLALEFLRDRDGNGLEFGNVLSRYGVSSGITTVVDKYERAPGVVNEDIVDFAPNGPFDFIVSISTLEHVGWDERPRTPEKVELAFHRLRSLLAPSGRMFVTTPLGHNEALDAAVLEKRWPVECQTTLVRDGAGWTATPELEWRPYEVGRGANAIWVAIVASSDENSDPHS